MKTIEPIVANTKKEGRLVGRAWVGPTFFLAAFLAALTFAGPAQALDFTTLYQKDGPAAQSYFEYEADGGGRE